MGPHSTWYDFLPGYETLKHNLQIYLGRDWTWQVFQATHFEIAHILGGVLVAQPVVDVRVHLLRVPPVDLRPRFFVQRPCGLDECLLRSLRGDAGDAFRRAGRFSLFIRTKEQKDTPVESALG